MPAAIAHYFHGKTVAKALSIPESAAFTLGCQGPDFLFCHRFFPWQKGEKIEYFGGFLHDTPPQELFARMQACVKEQDSPLLKEYMRGFLCHYALDRNCHPYVNSLANRLFEEDSTQTRGIFHNEIESALDTIILRQETGKVPAEFRLQDTMAAPEELAAVLAPFYTALAKLYGKDIPEALFRQAMKDAGFTFAILRDRFGVLRPLAKLIEGKQRKLTCHFRPMLENPDVDYANVGEKTWANARTGDPRDVAFFTLFEEAAEDAANLIRAFDANKPLETLCDRHF